MPQLYGFRRGPARKLHRLADVEGIVGRPRTKHAYPQFGPEYAPQLCIAKVGGTAIPAATEAAGVRTVGKGNVTLQVTDDDDELTDALDDSAAAIVVEVLNWSLSASGTDTYVWIAMSAVDGKLYYVNEPC